MILVYFAALAVIVGYIRGGTLSGILDMKIRWVVCPILGFLLEAFYAHIFAFFGLQVKEWLWLAVLVEYALLLAFVVVNIRQKAFIVTGIGLLLNFAVIAANGFSMPVSPEILNIPALEPMVSRIYSGELAEYFIAVSGANLYILSDIIFIPFPAGFASIGDVVIAAGVFLFIQGGMRLKKKDKRKPAH